MSDRITRTFVLRVPRWRTRYERPVNWLWFHWYDFVPLVLALVVQPPEPFIMLTSLYCFIALPVIVWRRLRARQRFCESQGAHLLPFKPIPEVDEWECAYCGAELVAAGPRLVSTRVAYEASRVKLAQNRGQAWYSDRR